VIVVVSWSLTCDGDGDRDVAVDDPFLEIAKAA
jgi:hypothetical protein